MQNGAVVLDFMVEISTSPDEHVDGAARGRDRIITFSQAGAGPKDQ
jgi:hypothetical protein